MQKKKKIHVQMSDEKYLLEIELASICKKTLASTLSVLIVLSIFICGQTMWLFFVMVNADDFYITFGPGASS